VEDVVPQSRNRFSATKALALTLAAARHLASRPRLVVMTCEIRDFGNGEIAVKLSLTGHLVLQHAAHQLGHRQKRGGRVWPTWDCNGS